MSGVLYIVATPIGNLEDLTARAARILMEADLVCCEDTRHSGKLLHHIGSKAPTLSVHEHNERERVERVLREVGKGKKVALISDSGCPAVSDPGFLIVRACREAGLEVVPVPGASAVTTSLMGAGLPSPHFAFYGFPPDNAGKRLELFRRVASYPMTSVFYLSPHKAAKQLKDIAEVFGERRAVLCREMTKIYEEFVTDSLDAIAGGLEAENPRGELTLVVSGAPQKSGADEEERERVLKELAGKGLGGRKLAEALKERLGISKNAAYRLAHEIPEKDE